MTRKAMRAYHNVRYVVCLLYYLQEGVGCVCAVPSEVKYEAQTALFKDPVRTAQ